MNGQLMTLIDEAISSCSGRGIISTSEMVDMLLDMRLLALDESCQPCKEQEVDK